ncbi:MAG: hypothetical protein CFE31_18080 [Rhizobiales bacterium PAR1]|nr:MAG: hypothetical protein CFE31_18080 [Rhizobiales bacterium PAR1]
MKKYLSNVILLVLSFILAGAGFYAFSIYGKRHTPEGMAVSGEKASAIESANPTQPDRQTARDLLILKPIPFGTGNDWQNREFPVGSFSEAATPGPALRADPPVGERAPVIEPGAISFNCSAIPAVKTVSLLQAYRGGLIEINEKEENADKIVTASLDWTVACPQSGGAKALVVSSTLRLAGYEPIALSLDYQVIGKSVQLREAGVSFGPSAAKSFVFNGLEFRQTGLRYGTTVRAEIDISKPGATRFRLANANEPMARESALVTLNAQWVDFPMLLGNRKFVLAIELPVPRTLIPE